VLIFCPKDRDNASKTIPEIPKRAGKYRKEIAAFNKNY
jgi:hypothetical protein